MLRLILCLFLGVVWPVTALADDLYFVDVFISITSLRQQFLKISFLDKILYFYISIFLYLKSVQKSVDIKPVFIFSYFSPFFQR